MPFTSNLFNYNDITNRFDNDFTIGSSDTSSDQETIYLNNNNSNNNNTTKQINYSRYKTELCRQFSENGEFISE